MGLSKKLGGTSQKVTSTVSTAVPYKWSNQTYTIEEILKKFKLPCVVQCSTDSCSVVWSEFQFDLQQPMLLYSRRSVPKVHACSLRKIGDALEEMAPPLAIPVDYEGWFAPTPKGANIARRHLRVEGVANSTACRFLVTTKCPAFTSSRGPDGNLDYVPHDVMPGEVLKRICLMDSNSSHAHQPKMVKEHGPCLECLDEKDEPVILPLSHRVIAYEVAETYPDDEGRVFRIDSLIKTGNSKLPRILTLVHGDPPLLDYTFTGMMRCYSIFNEETLQAATLDDSNSRCLELATDSCAKFKLALNEASIKKTCEYANALQISESFGSKFVTGIKVSFSLTPDISHLDDIDLSFYESASDMQEVEANSEFEIAWNSVKKAKLLIESNALDRDTDSSETEDVAEVTPSREDKKDVQKDILLAKTSTNSDSSIPQHRDFTEQEIEDLMIRKGLMKEGEKGTETPIEREALKENRVTDNPLYYFLQRQPQQAPQSQPKSMETEEEEASPTDTTQGGEMYSMPKEGKNSPVALRLNETDSTPSEKPENPLSYLFEPPEKLQPNEVPKSPTDATRDCGTFSEETVSTGLEIDRETSYYHDVQCKAAKEYSEDDGDDVDTDDDDNDEDEDDGEVHSDTDQILDIIQELSTPDVKGNTIHKDEASSRPDAFPDLARISEMDAPTTTLITQNYLLNPLTEDPNPLKVKVHTKLSDDSESAVNDLLYLAETESRKHSLSSLSEDGTHKSPEEQDATSSLTDTANDNRKDTACRLNNLIDEVTLLVNTSGNRFLDAKKHHPASSVSNDVIFSDNSLITPASPLSKNNVHISVNQTGQLTDSESLIQPVAAEEVLLSAEDCVSSIKPPSIVLDESGNQRQVSKPASKWKKMDDKLNNNSKRLDPKKSKSVDNSRGLRRSQVERDLARIGHDKEGDILSPHEFIKKFGSESMISSIFNASNDQDSRFGSSKVKHHPHEHPHRLSSDGEDLEHDHKQRSYSLEGRENDVFAPRTQRNDSINRGRVLASVQNFERLGSANSSMSSGRSSSIGSSYRLGSPKLVLISDAGRDVIETDTFSDQDTGNSLSDQDVKQPQFGSRQKQHSQFSSIMKTDIKLAQDKHAFNDSHEEGASFEKHLAVSKSGRLKHTKVTKSRGKVLLNEMNEDFV